MDNIIVMVEHHPAMTTLITSAVIAIFSLFGWFINHSSGKKNLHVNDSNIVSGDKNITAGRDVNIHINKNATVQEETKIVNDKWLEFSGKQKELEIMGHKVGWSNLDRVEERIANGHEIVYDFDNTRNIRTKYTNKSGQVLMRSRLNVNHTKGQSPAITIKILNLTQRHNKTGSFGDVMILDGSPDGYFLHVQLSNTEEAPNTIKDITLNINGKALSLYSFKPIRINSRDIEDRTFIFAEDIDKLIATGAFELDVIDVLDRHYFKRGNFPTQ